MLAKVHLEGCFKLKFQVCDCKSPWLLLIFEVELENLEFQMICIRDVGQGAFGRVFQAKVPGMGLLIFN